MYKKIVLFVLLGLLVFAGGCSDDDAAATYTVTYAANGATGGSAPTDDNVYTAGSAVTVLSNSGNLVKTGSTFAGWNSAADGNGTGYPAGGTLTMPAGNVTLYADWNGNPYTVTFDKNDAAATGTMSAQTINCDQSAPLTANGFSKTNFTFAGWATTPDGDVAYTNQQSYTMGPADVTLYAKWVYDFSAVTYRDMVSVPGGTYLQQETEGSSFEHTVSGFSIGKYEVTYELWYTVYSWATDNGYTFANAGKEGHDGTAGAVPAIGKYEPVTMVNWRDVIVWCNAYSQMAGLTPVYYSDSGKTTPLKDSSDGSYGSTVNTNAGSYDNPYVSWSADGYRLPTEGEWQYAASYQDGSSWTPYNYASGATADYTDATATKEVAWYSENSYSTTHEVGYMFADMLANQLGIHDMSGNVYEWCWDWYGTWPNGSQSDYRGPSSGSFRGGRGGSYNYSASYLQVGNRGNYYPFNEGYNFGFRLSRTP